MYQNRSTQRELVCVWKAQMQVEIVMWVWNEEADRGTVYVGHRCHCGGALGMPSSVLKESHSFLGIPAGS